jgi:hypothetical protein
MGFHSREIQRFLCDNPGAGAGAGAGAVSGAMELKELLHESFQLFL